VIGELDLARIRRHCAKRIPAHVRDRICLDVEVSGRVITSIERRAPWSPEIGPEWTRTPIARLRQRADNGAWQLFWCDHNGAWHRDPVEPTTQVGALLERIEADPDARYWG
jgi:hypothetical protein